RTRIPSTRTTALCRSVMSGSIWSGGSITGSSRGRNGKLGRDQLPVLQRPFVPTALPNPARATPVIYGARGPRAAASGRQQRHDVVDGVDADGDGRVRAAADRPEQQAEREHDGDAERRVLRVQRREQ